jgi:hypothetical protein
VKGYPDVQFVTYLYDDADAPVTDVSRTLEEAIEYAREAESRRTRRALGRPRTPAVD